MKKNFFKFRILEQNQSALCIVTPSLFSIFSWGCFLFLRAVKKKTFVIPLSFQNYQLIRIEVTNVFVNWLIDTPYLEKMFNSDCKLQELSLLDRLYLKLMTFSIKKFVILRITRPIALPEKSADKTCLKKAHFYESIDIFSEQAVKIWAGIRKLGLILNVDSFPKKIKIKKNLSFFSYQPLNRINISPSV